MWWYQGSVFPLSSIRLVVVSSSLLFASVCRLSHLASLFSTVYACRIAGGSALRVVLSLRRETAMWVRFAAFAWLHSALLRSALPHSALPLFASPRSASPLFASPRSASPLFASPCFASALRHILLPAYLLATPHFVAFRSAAFRFAGSHLRCLRHLPLRIFSGLPLRIVSATSLCIITAPELSIISALPLSCFPPQPLCRFAYLPPRHFPSKWP